METKYIPMLIGASVGFVIGYELTNYLISKSTKTSAEDFVERLMQEPIGEVTSFPYNDLRKLDIKDKELRK